MYAMKEMCVVIMKLEDDLTPNNCPLFQIVIPDWRRVHREGEQEECVFNRGH